MTHQRCDQFCDPDRQVRVEVHGWICTAPVSGQYIERPHSVRMVANYLRRIGPTAVARKIRSRLAERTRNNKVAGIGHGVVLSAPPGAAVLVGQAVLFFAPNHSVDWRRLVVDAALVAPVTARSSAGTTLEWARLPDVLRGLAGWSPDSGRPLPAGASESVASLAATHAPSSVAPTTPIAPVNERVEEASVATTRPRAVVFGLGNYAKTQIVPPVRAHLHLAAVHEVDPDQLMAAQGLGCARDTAPEPRADERYDAWFIAGFHHTHADIAVRAITDGAYAVVEKPLVTTRAQLDRLTRAVSAHPDRLFACFQKRYSRQHEWAVRDLGIQPGDPVDMHSLVYEIPLPPLHWYQWPASGSRLISNGCHWLDYFLFVNGNSPVVDAQARRLRGADVLAWARLENGAQMSLSLTDAGSARLGVRDVIDLRAGDTTVRLTDATGYEAETSARVIRRRRVNPMDAYRRMYDTICRTIVSGGAADPPASLQSSALMLEMDAQLT